MAVRDALVPLGTGTAPTEEGPVRVEVVAEGIFWPVGLAGETGTVIGEVRAHHAMAAFTPST